MRKTIEEVNQYVSAQQVRFVYPITKFPPVDDVSIKMLLVCGCGTQFTETPRSLTEKFKKCRSLSCGCLRKKWTNDTIDKMLQERNLNVKRITDCYSIKTPSQTKIEWECLTCKHTWKTTVNQMSYAKIACVSCNGNLKYTVESLNEKLKSLGRVDIFVISLKSGTKKQPRRGLFQCIKCDHNWDALIHNIVKFGYGCPSCNNNSSVRVHDTQYGMFHSKLEYYFWTECIKNHIDLGMINRQTKYLKHRQLKCDYNIPSLKIWIEISGTVLLKKIKYTNTIDEKRKIIEDRNEIFYNLHSHSDIVNCVKLIKQQLNGSTLL